MQTRENEEPRKRKKPVYVKHKSMAWLRKQGYIVADVERAVSIPGIPGGEGRRFTVDCLGFADLLAFKSEADSAMTLVTPCLLVNPTDHTNVAHRVLKGKLSKGILEWLRAGHDAEVHGWTRPTGKQRKQWRLRRVGLRPVRDADGIWRVVAFEINEDF